VNVRVIRPFGPFEIDAGGARFSTAIEASDADALLCEWAPHPDLLTFGGPSAWFTAEPRTNPRIGVLAHADQRRFLTLLRPEQLLHHAHDDSRFRVPHMTHATPEPSGYTGPREPVAATVVSNYGGPIRNRGPDILLRNAFATAPGVALFGRRTKWKHYRARGLSWPRLPRGFRGAVEDFTSEKVDLLARFHTAICLENTCEPLYFSEKFVDGVRAGCVPVYRAHPTVRDGVLAGARWIDPRDHGLDVRRTLDAALSTDREAVAERNLAWLESETVRRTSERAVWSRMAEALRHQGSGRQESLRDGLRHPGPSRVETPVDPR
jgi:hypothetical protein